MKKKPIEPPTEVEPQAVEPQPAPASPPALPLNPVAEELRAFRHRHGVAQHGMSILLGVTDATISRWECGWPIQHPQILSLALKWMDHTLTLTAMQTATMEAPHAPTVPVTPVAPVDLPTTD